MRKTILFCDRCKKQTEELKDLYEDGKLNEFYWCRHRNFYSICTECWNKLQAFLSGVSK